MQLLYLCAPNDRNGNPQRAWVYLDDAGIACDYFNEGYSGTAAVPEHLRQWQLVAPRINVSAKELRSWEKAAKAVSAEREAALAQ